MILRITESALVRDVRSVLESVERGDEVIIEREDHRPVAVIKQAQPVGRSISECIALAEAYENRFGDAPISDEDIARDVHQGIDASREPIRNVWDWPSPSPAVSSEEPRSTEASDC
jgi:antitoxin (DNA-binding transcriptional repressor) of toxin-antitoxin stability system